MASSSVSQESIEIEDYDLCTRRSRIRMMRGRNTAAAHKTEYHESMESGDHKDAQEDEPGDVDTNGVIGDHESPTRLANRLKDKRVIRPNHLHKGKINVKDKRKLREKRRSTGVVHLQQPSTESTGDSVDEDHETRKNTAYNEFIDEDNPQTPEEERKAFAARSVRNKSSVTCSPSDLEADFEDNQDYDSTVSQSETNLSTIGQSSNDNHQSDSPVRKAQACAASRLMNSQNGVSDRVRACTTAMSRETTPTDKKERSPPSMSTVRSVPERSHPPTTLHSFTASPRSSQFTLSQKASQYHATAHAQVPKHDSFDEAESRRSRQRVHWHPTSSPAKQIFMQHTSTTQHNHSIEDLALKMRDLEVVLARERQERQREKEERQKLQELLMERDKTIQDLQREIAFVHQELETMDGDNKTLHSENQTLLNAITRLSIKQ